MYNYAVMQINIPVYFYFALKTNRSFAIFFKEFIRSVFVSKCNHCGSGLPLCCEVQQEGQKVRSICDTKDGPKEPFDYFILWIHGEKLGYAILFTFQYVLYSDFFSLY